MKTLKHLLAVVVVLMLINDAIQIFLEYRSYRKKLNQMAAMRLIRTMKRRAEKEKQA